MQLQTNALYSAIASRGCLNRLADSLDRIGYAATKVASAAASTTKLGSFSSLRHEYISINLDGQEYIVDPSFKEHFVVQNPTTRYAAILDLIPATVVVASRQQLTRAVAFLATELQRCFEARKVSLPPWRRLKSLLSKWEAGTPVTITRRAEPPTAAKTTTTTKAALGSQFVTHSFPHASSSSFPQSVLESKAFLETESKAFPRKIVGFEIAGKGECFCCGLRRRMLKESTRQDMHCVAYSAPAA
jgi:uncharacterized protein (TIGR01615 family)